MKIEIGSTKAVLNGSRIGLRLFRVSQKQWQISGVSNDTSKG